MARLLHIAPFPFPAPFGSQVYAAGLAEAQAALGHEVYLACYADGIGDPPPGVQLVRSRAGALRRGPSLGKIVANGSLMRRVRALHRRVNLDLVLGHNVEGPFLPRLARVDVPRVYLQHTRMGEELPDWLGAPAVSRPLGRLVDRLASSSAVLTVGLSDRGDGDVVVPPGIRPEELDVPYDFAERPGLPPGPWVAYVGNTDAYQDLPDLFAACALGDLPLLVVTGDPLPPLHRAADAAGVSQRFFLRTAAFADHKAALAASTVAAIPRRTAAGFPMKLLNQLGVGTPTVGTTGALPELPGVTRVPPGDIQALASALGRHVAQPEFSARKGAEGRSEVLSRWTWQARAQQLDEHLTQHRLLPRCKGGILR